MAPVSTLGLKCPACQKNSKKAGAWPATLKVRALAHRDFGPVVVCETDRLLCSRPRMAKLIELSIIIGLIAVPARASRQKNPRKGLRKVVINMLILECCYMLAMRFLHGRI